MPELPLLTPTPGQLAWQQLRIGMFFHVGINTYFGQEWSDGSLPAVAFDPAELDVDGLDGHGAGRRCALRDPHRQAPRRLLLVADEHDHATGSLRRRGEAATATWSANSSRPLGARACSRGSTCRPGTATRCCYADPVAYSRFYITQLTELCTRYGELAELWFDGAGSEGYSYDWPAITAVLRAHQPHAMVFNMGAPTIRWVGNEDGLASDPVDYVRRPDPVQSVHGGVQRAHRVALPAAGVRRVAAARLVLGAGRPTEPKTVDHLLAIYYRSVGLGANLLLNVPPDPSGRIDPADAAVVRAFGAEVRPSVRGRGRARLTPVRTCPSPSSGRV